MRLNGSTSRLRTSAPILGILLVAARPNVAVPVANMAALASPPDARQEAIRRLRQNAAR